MKQITISHGLNRAVALVPERQDVDGLMVGMVAPNVFGEGVVDEIRYTGTDIHGKRFVGYVCRWPAHAPAGNTITGSLKEGELIRTLDLCNLFDSWDLDRAEKASAKGETSLCLDAPMIP